MPRTAIDYRAPETENSLKQHLKGSLKTTALCVTVVYPGSPHVFRHDIAVDGGANEIFTDGNEAIFQEFEAGDSIIVRGPSNSGRYTINSVAADDKGIFTNEDLVTDQSLKARDIRKGDYIGFTTLDRDITFNGLVYKAIPGMENTALQINSSREDDNMEIAGFFHPDGFTRADILNGIYDDAYMEIFVLNYQNLDMGRYILTQGKLGEFQLTDFGYKAEFRSFVRMLDQEIGEIYQPADRRPIDDPDWGIDLSNYKESGWVTLVSNNKKFAVTIDLPITSPAHIAMADYEDYIDPASPDNPATGANWFDWWFKKGTLLCTSGANEGRTFEVAHYDKITWPDDPDQGLVLFVELATSTLFEIQPGDTFEIVAGYDRSWTQRVSKFNDPEGFLGEPFLPGRGAIMKVYDGLISSEDQG